MPKSDTRDRGRFSARRKTEAVLRLLGGEGLDTLSRELGVTAATLSGWREDIVIAVAIAERQRSDSVLAKPVLAEAGRVVGRIDEVLADKGIDSDKIHEACLDEHDALPVIPNRKNRNESWPWDDTMKETYKERTRVERPFGKAKQFRRFATHCEKLGETFLGFVRLVFGFIHLKKIALFVNTP